MSEERKIKENKNGAARTATVSPFNFANYRSSRSVCEAGAAISVSSFISQSWKQYNSNSATGNTDRQETMAGYETSSKTETKEAKPYATP